MPLASTANLAAAFKDIAAEDSTLNAAPDLNSMITLS
jgi:hypothetical protein